MVFISYQYLLIFLPIVAFLFFLSKNKRQCLYTIILASLVFYYTWGGYTYLSLLLFSLFFNFFITKYGIKKFRGSKLPVAFGVIVNIGLLGYFKYTNFFIDNFNLVFGLSIEIGRIVLPLAISFYTFQQIAWLIDNYKNEAPECDFVEYACAVLFFPHLIAGPIVQYHDLVPQLNTIKKAVDYKLILNGLFLIGVGCFKKAYIADYISFYVDFWYNDYLALNTYKAWLAVLGYASQIYFDFSGYCDIAIGSALLFGVTLPANFNDPYKATSIQDFWRRWHITLGYFLTKYVYIPLGGNRKGNRRTLINIFLMLCISGLWHGAGLTFVIWGALHGAAMVIHRLYSKAERKIVLNKYLSIFITFVAVLLFWIVFRANNLECAWSMFTNLFSGNLPTGVNWEAKTGFDMHELRPFIYMLVFSYLVIYFTPKAQDLFDKYSEKFPVILAVAAIGLIWISLYKILSNSYTTFIYFNF